MKETAEDCPWASIAREFSQSNKSSDDLEAILRKWSPNFYESLLRDAKNLPAKDLWGLSSNFDENTHAETVDRTLLSHVLTWMEAPPLSGPDSRITHAGIEHTYGYMMSNLLTSRGYKRLRWVRGYLESGFGLPQGVLGPLPHEGTMLTNVTYFLGKLALIDHPESQAILEDFEVPLEFKRYPYQKLKVQRLEEVIDLSPEEKFTIRTDIVPFPNEVEHLPFTGILIYSVLDSTEGRPRLITGFPIDQAVANSILDKSRLGPNQPIEIRFNAYIPGLSEESSNWKGVRRISSAHNL